MAILDLTHPMDDGLPIYAEEGYSDPPFERAAWCSIESRGFQVSSVRMGTQTGTHIDAPAHFVAGGATLDALPVDRLMGGYALIDLPGAGAVPDALRSGAEGASILFLRAPAAESARLSPAGLDALLRAPAGVWVVDGSIEVEGRPALEFHRRLAAAGIYLIEDLRREAARAVQPGGELIALPLALVGTSGAPCRVVVRP